MLKDRGFQPEDWMKDKVLFFLLGSVLATMAYFIGDINLSMDEKNLVVDPISVREHLTVGGSVYVSASFKSTDGDDKKHPMLILSADANRAALMITESGSLMRGRNISGSV